MLSHTIIIHYYRSFLSEGKVVVNKVLMKYAMVEGKWISDKIYLLHSEIINFHITMLILPPVGNKSKAVCLLLPVKYDKGPILSTCPS